MALRPGPLPTHQAAPSPSHLHFFMCETGRVAAEEGLEAGQACGGRGPALQGLVLLARDSSLQSRAHLLKGLLTLSL